MPQPPLPERLTVILTLFTRESRGRAAGRHASPPRFAHGGIFWPRWGSVLLLGLAWAGLTPRGTAAAEARSSTNAPADYSTPADPVFSNALAMVSQQRGLRAVACDSILTEWRTNLCLLLGIRIDAGSNRFVNLIELTTLPPDPATGTNQSQVPPPATMDWTCWKSDLISTSRVYHITSPRYPVRVRVYDEKGGFLRESREYLPWCFLTNDITQACVCMTTTATNAAAKLAAELSLSKGSAAKLSPAAKAEAVAIQLKLERVMPAGLAALLALFNDTLAASSLEEVRQRALPVARSPSILKIIANFGMTLNLDPKFDQAALLPTEGDAEVRAWLPVELLQGKRLLLSVAFITGSTQGPHFLTGGVRALRAVHPTKPDRRLLAQVLAVGEATVEVPLAKVELEQRPRNSAPKERSQP